MRVAAAMVMLLYCVIVASAVAVNNDASLADDDAAPEDDVESLMERSKAALKRHAPERDSEKLDGQEHITNKMLLKAIKETSTCSDNGGLLQLLFIQIHERVTQNGANIRVLEAHSTADKQTLSEMKERVTQSGAKIRVLEAESTADKQRLRTLTRQLEQTSQDGAGASTFVRWGSSTCGAGNASSLVYPGVVGGGYFAHGGAAVNFLCLTLSPRLSQQAPPALHAYLYGGEYETQDSHQDKNPVCAVCRAASSTTVMIPGTDTCTPGWRLQYSGFLMAGRYNHPASSEYICVDRALESAHSGDSSQNGAMLYYTKTACGALPCLPTSMARLSRASSAPSNRRIAGR